MKASVYSRRKKDATPHTEPQNETEKEASTTIKFCKKLVIKVLRKHYHEEANRHNHEENEECEICRRCRLITGIAEELGIYGDVTYIPIRRETKAFTRGLHGERFLTRDWDMRVRARARAGK